MLTATDLRTSKTAKIKKVLLLYNCTSSFVSAGHILTVQSNQFCAVQKAECAVQVAKLCSPKYVLSHK